MSSKTRYRVRGPFSVQSLGAGNWVLSDTSAGAQVYLKVGESEVAKLAHIAEARTLEVDWRGEEVIVTFGASTDTERLTAMSAIVHESKERLYDALPLAHFDRSARRFWDRVFRVMRLPGGRFLLRFLASGRR